MRRKNEVVHQRSGLRPELATWSDLPVEIVDQIIVLCDTAALLSLSQLNHALNYLALKRYFKVENTASPTQGYIVSRLAARHLLPALNTALWLDHLPSVIYYLNPDVMRLFDEVRRLTRLIERVKRNERLDLYFSCVDRWLADWSLGRESETGYGVTAVDVGVWVRIWVRLLEVALKAGCRSIRVDGAHVLDMYYLPRSVSRIATGVEAAVPAVGAVPGVVRASRLTLRKRFARWIKKRLGVRASSSPTLAEGPKIILTPPGTSSPPEHEPPPMLDEVTSFQTSSPCLTTLRLRSSMMMQRLFFPHTINLIRNHSSVLCYLKLVSIKVDSLVWQEFFPKLALPALQHFTYLFDTLIVEEPPITPQLLLDFFVRHPTIQKLELYGVSVRDQFPSVEPTLLPNLRHLDAHPRIVSWLLQHPTSCPLLRFVSLTSEHPGYSARSGRSDPYESFDDGIRALASLIDFKTDTNTGTTANTSTGTDFYPSRPPQPHKLHIQFKFSTECCLLSWLLSNTALSRTPPGSPIQSLRATTRLTLAGHFHTPFIPHLHVLPEFLRLFPSLRWLEMVELVDAEAVRGDKNFVSGVKDAVGGLERWLVERVWVVGERPGENEGGEEC